MNPKAIKEISLEEAQARATLKNAAVNLRFVRQELELLQRRIVDCVPDKGRVRSHELRVLAKRIKWEKEW